MPDFIQLPSEPQPLVATRQSPIDRDAARRAHPYRGVTGHCCLGVVPAGAKEAGDAAGMDNGGILPKGLVDACRQAPTGLPGTHALMQLPCDASQNKWDGFRACTAAPARSRLASSQPEWKQEGLWGWRTESLRKLRGTFAFRDGETTSTSTPLAPADDPVWNASGPAPTHDKIQQHSTDAAVPHLSRPNCYLTYV